MSEFSLPEGWQTTKDHPDDPPHWYDYQLVLPFGSLYRRRSADAIALIEQRRTAERLTAQPLRLDRPCTKCGSVEAMAQYDSHSDLITRTCVRCGYGWRELPLDAEAR